MKYIINILLIISSVSFSQAKQLGDDEMLTAKPIGERYFEYLSQVQQNGAAHGAEILSPSVQKKVVSKVLCTSRDEAIQQLQDLINMYGIKKVELKELIIAKDPKINIIQFEITYNDSAIDVVTSILKCDDNGLIREINQVYNEKGTFDWQPKKQIGHAESKE